MAHIRGARRWARVAAVVMVGTVLHGLPGGPRPAAATETTPVPSADDVGTEFWAAVPQPLGDDVHQARLHLTSTGAAASGVVEVPGQSFSASFTVPAAGTTSVVLPAGATTAPSAVPQRRAIRVTADAPIAARLVSQERVSSDVTMLLPVDALGTDHRVLAWSGADPALVGGNTALGSQVTIAAPTATTVTVTPTAPASGLTAGVAHTIALAAGDVLALAGSGAADLTGTRVQSEAPVAVFGGARCGFVPTDKRACNHLVDQTPPTTVWGRDHYVGHTFRNGEVFRVVAAADDTVVRVDGAAVATLAAGGHHTVTAAADRRLRIDADRPILVGHLTTGQTTALSFDQAGDPSLSVVPAREHWRSEYVFDVPAITPTSGFVELALPLPAALNLLVDGAPPNGGFVQVGSTGVYVGRVPVSPGRHVLGSTQAFGAISYGLGTAEAYASPAGLSFGPAVSVASLALTPATQYGGVGTDSCFAVEAADASGAPVADVPVDVTLSGANAVGGTAVTGADGRGEWCGTVERTGTDTVTAAVGNVRATASIEWLAQTFLTYLGFTSVQYSDSLGLNAQLTNSSRRRIEGFVRFTVGSQTVGAWNDPFSNAQTSMKVLQSSGVRPLVTSYAGDPSVGYGRSTDTDDLTILREDCGLTAVVPTASSISPSVPFDVVATLSEPDASLGDLSGKTVTVTFDGGPAGIRTFSATSGADRVARVRADLPSGTWTMRTSFAGDGFYVPCAAATQTLTVLQPTRLTAAPVADGVVRTAEGTVFSAVLTTASGVPLPGRVVEMTAGGRTCTATTDASGRARCGGALEVASAVAAGGYRALFRGDQTYRTSNATAAVS